MNDIVTIPALPNISRALGAAMSVQRENIRFGASETPQERSARLRRGEVAPGMVIRIPIEPPSLSVVTEAKRILPQLEAAMAPASPKQAMASAKRILDKLNGSVSSPLGSMGLMARIAALAEAGSELPVAAWDRSNDSVILRSFKFMPSVSEIVEILESSVQPMKDTIASVRRVASFVHKEVAVREKPTAEEVERRQAAVADLQREARERDREDQEIRDFGMWMPEGSEGMTGTQLAAALRLHLEGLDGPKLRITQERIEKLERNAAIAAQLSR